MTVNVTGGGSSGGLLPAGVYFAAYTWTDGAGETTKGTSETASSFTVSAGNIPQVTVPALPTGAAGWNLYLTAAGGASGTETLYSVGNANTASNIAGATNVDTSATPPTTNTTGMSNAAPAINKPFELYESRTFQDWSTHVSNFNSAYPVAFAAWWQNWTKKDYVAATWKQLTKEVATLVSANPGTLHNKSTNVINTVYRTWP
jgi:hypothetical protein